VHFAVPMPTLQCRGGWPQLLLAAAVLLLVLQAAHASSNLGASGYALSLGSDQGEVVVQPFNPVVTIATKGGRAGRKPRHSRRTASGLGRRVGSHELVITTTMDTGASEQWAYGSDAGQPLPGYQQSEQELQQEQQFVQDINEGLTKEAQQTKAAAAKPSSRSNKKITAHSTSSSSKKTGSAAKATMANKAAKITQAGSTSTVKAHHKKKKVPLPQPAVNAAEQEEAVQPEQPVIEADDQEAADESNQPSDAGSTETDSASEPSSSDDDVAAAETDAADAADESSTTSNSSADETEARGQGADDEQSEGAEGADDTSSANKKKGSSSTKGASKKSNRKHSSTTKKHSHQKASTKKVSASSPKATKHAAKAKVEEDDVSDDSPVLADEEAASADADVAAEAADPAEQQDASLTADTDSSSEAGEDEGAALDVGAAESTGDADDTAVAEEDSFEVSKQSSKKKSRSSNSQASRKASTKKTSKKHKAATSSSKQHKQQAAEEEQPVELDGQVQAQQDEKTAQDTLDVGGTSAAVGSSTAGQQHNSSSTAGKQAEDMPWTLTHRSKTISLATPAMDGDSANTASSSPSPAGNSNATAAMVAVAVAGPRTSAVSTRSTLDKAYSSGMAQEQPDNTDTNDKSSSVPPAAQGVNSNSDDSAGNASGGDQQEAAAPVEDEDMVVLETPGVDAGSTPARAAGTPQTATATDLETAARQIGLNVKGFGVAPSSSSSSSTSSVSPATVAVAALFGAKGSLPAQPGVGAVGADFAQKSMDQLASLRDTIFRLAAKPNLLHAIQQKQVPYGIYVSVTNPDEFQLRFAASQQIRANTIFTSRQHMFYAAQNRSVEAACRQRHHLHGIAIQSNSINLHAYGAMWHAKIRIRQGLCMVSAAALCQHPIPTLPQVRQIADSLDADDVASMTAMPGLRGMPSIYRAGDDVDSQLYAKKTALAVAMTLFRHITAEQAAKLANMLIPGRYSCPQAMAVPQ